MVDFSLQPISDMQKLSEIVGPECFTWIDHHQTAIDSAYEFDKNNGTRIALLPGQLSSGKAAVELCWNELFSAWKNTPLIVTLVGRYDVWDHECPEHSWEKEILPFQKGLYSENCDPGTPDGLKFWEKALFDPAFDPQKYIDIGLKKIERSKQENKAILSEQGFEARLILPDKSELPVLAINRGRPGSLFFENRYDKSKHYACVGFVMTKTGGWNFSLYSEDNDVGALAKTFGGGGHKGASGFQSRDLDTVLKWERAL